MAIALVIDANRQMADSVCQMLEVSGLAGNPAC